MMICAVISSGRGIFDQTRAFAMARRSRGANRWRARLHCASTRGWRQYGPTSVCGIEYRNAF